VLLLLRHPVERAISHFEFAKKQPWSEGRRLRRLTLEEYLNDYEEMMCVCV